MCSVRLHNVIMNGDKMWTYLGVTYDLLHTQVRLVIRLNGSNCFLHPQLKICGTKLKLCNVFQLVVSTYSVFYLFHSSDV